MKTLSFYCTLLILLGIISISNFNACTQLVTPYSSTFIDRTWVPSGNANSEGVYDYIPSSPLNSPYNSYGGFSLKSSGEFVSYTSQGWCGTPLIISEFRGGKWTSINDSTFSIKAAYWGTQYIAGQEPAYIKYTMIIKVVAPDKIRVLRN